MRILDNLGTVHDPFQPGVVILNKLISNLKSKFSSKKNNEDEYEDEELEDVEAEDSERLDDSDKTGETDISDLEEEDEDSEPVSIVDKIKSKLGLNKKSAAAAASDENELDEEEDAEAAKKKRTSIIIRAVIAIGLVVFLAEDYIFPPEEEPVPVAPSTQPRPYKKDVTQQAPEEAPAETPVDAPAEGVAEAPVEEPAEAPAPETDVAEAEPTDSGEAPAGEAPVEEAPVEEAPLGEASVSDSTPVAEEPVLTDEEDIDDPDISDVTTVTSTPSDDSISEPQTTPDLSGESGFSGGEDSIGEDMAVGDDSNLTDQILKDLEKQAKSDQSEDVKVEYTSPPNYDYRGRGLVYNCQGKHWACVDGPSYKKCEDNSASVKYLKRPIECYPFNVYETVRGCEGMQYRMVSSSAKTNFCNEN